MNELITKIIIWGRDKNLLDPRCRDKQLIKIQEELGELSSAHLKNDYSKLVDGIGDVLVTLILFAAQNRLTLDECLQYAYDEIKDRKGKTVNNTFIKEIP